MDTGREKRGTTMRARQQCRPLRIRHASPECLTSKQVGDLANSNPASPVRFQTLPSARAYDMQHMRLRGMVSTKINPAAGVRCCTKCLQPLRQQVLLQSVLHSLQVPCCGLTPSVWRTSCHMLHSCGLRTAAPQMRSGLR